MQTATACKRAVFIGGPYDGQSLPVSRVPQPVPFLYDSTEYATGGWINPRPPGEPRETWQYSCHLYWIGSLPVAVYVVDGLNMDLARQRFLEVINSKT